MLGWPTLLLEVVKVQIMNTAQQIIEERFVQPTPEKISSLGRGCFVQVREQQGCFWAEITGGAAGTFHGMVHPELKSPCCKPLPNTGLTADFQSENITALGCDRYCFC